MVCTFILIVHFFLTFHFKWSVNFVGSLLILSLSQKIMKYRSLLFFVEIIRFICLCIKLLATTLIYSQQCFLGSNSPLFFFKEKGVRIKKQNHFKVSLLNLAASKTTKKDCESWKQQASWNSSHFWFGGRQDWYSWKIIHLEYVA